MPRFSVCIPTYNRAELLPRAIDSALRQTFNDFELVIGDNASTDDTVGILSRITDPRVRVFRNPETVSMYANHNLCLAQARADSVVFLHSDDVLTPDALEIFDKYCARYPDAAVLYPAKPMHRHQVSNAPLVLRDSRGAVCLFRWRTATPTGAFYRRERLPQFDMDTPAADLKVLFEVLLKGHSVVIIPDNTVSIGSGAHQYTSEWTRTGRYFVDVSRVLADAARHPDLLSALIRDFSSWHPEEKAQLLMTLAYGNEASLQNALTTACPFGCGLWRSRYYWIRLFQPLLGRSGLMCAARVKKVLRSAVGLEIHRPAVPRAPASNPPRATSARYPSRTV